MKKYCALMLLFGIFTFVGCSQQQLVATATETPSAPIASVDVVPSATPSSTSLVIDAPTPQLPTSTETVIIPASPTATLTLPSTPAEASSLESYRSLNYYNQPGLYFEVLYNPTQWALVDDAPDLETRLVHQGIDNCALSLNAGAMGVTSIAETELADWTWTIATGGSRVLHYSTPFENLAFFFDILLPEDFSPTEKDPCQQAAETVIDTFMIVETEASATPPATTPDPTTYRGLNPYNLPDLYFEVIYDSSSWTLESQEDDFPSSDLVHQSMPACRLRLTAGPLGTEPIATAYLANRQWIVSGSRILHYSSQFENLAFIFEVVLPEDDSAAAKSPCQQAAETVIDTFTIVDERS